MRLLQLNIYNFSNSEISNDISRSVWVQWNIFFSWCEWHFRYRARGSGRWWLRCCMISWPRTKRVRLMTASDETCPKPFQVSLRSCRRFSCTFAWTVVTWDCSRIVESSLWHCWISGCTLVQLSLLVSIGCVYVFKTVTLVNKVVQFVELLPVNVCSDLAGHTSDGWWWWLCNGALNWVTHPFPTNPCPIQYRCGRTQMTQHSFVCSGGTFAALYFLRQQQGRPLEPGGFQTCTYSAVDQLCRLPFNNFAPQNISVSEQKRFHGSCLWRMMNS